MEIDCVNKKIKDISVTIYDEKDNVIYSSPKSESSEWNAILPKTVGEKLINIVSCEPATPNESVVATKIDEPVTSKKVVVTHKVDKPVTAKKVVVAHSHRSTAYSGYVESFKSEDKAVIFVNKMKAKGFVAFYLKEDVPGKGKFYRAYVDR
jgi:cell division septation protein DedD